MPWLIFKIIVAIAAALTIYWIGAGIVRSFATAPPPDEEPDLQPVDVRYECVVCSSRVTMTATAEVDLPMAPRHCMEEMRLVADHRSN